MIIWIYKHTRKASKRHGYWNRVSQRGSRTNERSIRLLSLIKTIGGEFPVRQRNANHNCAYTRLQQILSQDSSRTSVLSFVPCTGLWRSQGTDQLESLEMYDYLILFQYPWQEGLAESNSWSHVEVLLSMFQGKNGKKKNSQELHEYMNLNWMINR